MSRAPSRDCLPSGCVLSLFPAFNHQPFALPREKVEDMMVEINADKEEAEVVRVKVEAEEAMANEKVKRTNACFTSFLHQNSGHGLVKVA